MILVQAIVAIPELRLAQRDGKQPGFAQLSAVAPLLQGSELAVLRPALLLLLCIALCPTEILLLTSMAFKPMGPKT